MGNQVSKEYLCDECSKGNHEKCESRISCDCKCNIGRAADVTQKVLTTVGGIGAAFTGLALTLGTGGLAIPIGGALMGAGISSAYQGIEKSIKQKRINGLEYVADISFGAVTGVVTGGIGGAGEALATNVAKEGAKNLAVRVGTGAVAGVTAKAIDEVKSCTTSEKKWSDYGKAIDKEGNCSVNGTAVSWISSVAVGSLGAAATHISTNASNAVSSGLQKATVRVAISGASGSATDAVSQILNITAGNQDEYDLKQTILAGTVSATITGAMESAKSGIYAYHGGEEKFIEKQTNKQLIEEKVPLEDKKIALEALDDLNKIPDKDVNNQFQKAKEYSDMKKKSMNLENKNNKQRVTKSELKLLGKNNAHALVENRCGQIAIDVKNPNDPNRGLKRLLFDIETKENGYIAYKLSDYTPNHDYDNMNGYGEASEVYQKCHDGNRDYINGLNNACEYGQKAIIAEEYTDSDDNDDDKNHYYPKKMNKFILIHLSNLHH